MPNWVPQSPRWLILNTSCPRNSISRAMLSPITVDLRITKCKFPNLVFFNSNLLRVTVFVLQLPNNTVILSIHKKDYWIITHLRWPTCISLAIFGEEKSMTTRNGVVGGGVTPFTTRLVTYVQEGIWIIPFYQHWCGYKHSTIFNKRKIMKCLKMYWVPCSS